MSNMKHILKQSSRKKNVRVTPQWLAALIRGYIIIAQVNKKFCELKGGNSIGIASLNHVLCPI